MSKSPTFTRPTVTDKVFILGIFLISICVRIPHLDRPVSKHHEFNSAMILIPMDVWEEEGLSKHHWSPVMSYTNPGDKKVNNMTKEYMQVEGDYYYLSFSSITYVLPYLSFKLFGLSPSPLALQVFNLFLLLCSLLLLYEILIRLFRDGESTNRARLTASIACILYAFTPISLWFHGNGYTHHVLLIPFILGFFMYYVKLLRRDYRNRALTMIGLVLFGVLASLTAWLGIILLVLTLLPLLIKWRSRKDLRISSLLIITSVISGFLIFYIQYKGLIGEELLGKYLGDRFTDRSGGNEGLSSLLNGIIALPFWYIVGYSTLCILLVFVFIQFVRNKLGLNYAQRSVLHVLLSGSMLHHILFNDFTVAHDYSVLLDGLFICILVAILLEKLNSKAVRFVLIGTITLFGIGQYFYVNRIGEYGQNGDRYDALQLIGATIGDSAEPDELVMVIGLKDRPSPQVMYYAKRNFLQLQNEEEIEFEMRLRGMKKGRVFFIEDLKVIDQMEINFK